MDIGNNDVAFKIRRTGDCGQVGYLVLSAFFPVEP
jgi:hypothetical protein